MPLRVYAYILSYWISACWMSIVYNLLRLSTADFSLCLWIIYVGLFITCLFLLFKKCVFKGLSILYYRCRNQLNFKLFSYFIISWPTFWGTIRYQYEYEPNMYLLTKLSFCGRSLLNNQLSVTCYQLPLTTYHLPLTTYQKITWTSSK